MARSERQVPTVYFGRPGQLLPLPWPRGDMDRPYERQTFDFLTGSGSHAISSLAAGSRAYTLSFNALHQDTFTNLEQFRIGANGPAPFVLIDPSAPNLLHANIAAATGIFNNATGFLTFTTSIAGDNGTPGSNVDPLFMHRATAWRSIRWRFLVAPAATVMIGVTPSYRSWAGIPVAPNLPYAFSSWMRVDGTVETNATLSMRLRWLDSTGTLIGTEVTGGDTSVTSTWQRLSVLSTAPSNAAYVVPRWYGVGSSIATNGIVYIDEPLLEQDTVVNNWAPASGVRPVEIVGLTETAPFAARFRSAIQLSLRELAR
jgi:hypothetical protein